MSYQTGEARLLTLLQAISPTTWTADNSVSLANDSSNVGQQLIQNGKSYHYLLLRPGSFKVQTGDVGFNTYLVQWQTMITLYVAKTSNKPPIKALAEDRQAIIDQLMKYERMNNLSGTVHAQIDGGGAIATERVGSGPMNKRRVLFKQEVIHLWEEKLTVSQQD